MGRDEWWEAIVGDDGQGFSEDWNEDEGSEMRYGRDIANLSLVRDNEENEDD